MILKFGFRMCGVKFSRAQRKGAMSVCSNPLCANSGASKMDSKRLIGLEEECRALVLVSEIDWELIEFK